VSGHMSESLHDLEITMRICLQAGNLMLKNGAETSRIEETITRLGLASGANHVHSFVTPTGIFITIHSNAGVVSRVYRIMGSPGINLYKVAEVNALSRRFEQGECTADEVIERLQRIEREGAVFPYWVTYLAAAISSGGFTILFGGSWQDFLPGACAGWVANTLMENLDPRMPRFLAVFFCAFVSSLLSLIFVLIGFGKNIDEVILGGVVPLVPGLAITNAVRDLMAGDLLSGLARSAETVLTAFAIAVAVAIVIVMRMWGFTI
jgi:uncharacterized membrane protein YjjP (DUF1212 family)